MKYRRNLITVAIDSPAAAGAGTQAKVISKEYNLLYLDTGKIYRYLAKITFNEKKINYNFLKKKIDRLNLRKLNDPDFAVGGRVNYALGTKPTAEESGLGGLPIEADMRYTGGFMPYGAKEKADDVPARLSKNEFVFTADAVRAAGGGSVNEGAKKMYATMKQLEAKPEAKGMTA